MADDTRGGLRFCAGLICLAIILADSEAAGYEEFLPRRERDSTSSHDPDQSRSESTSSPFSMLSILTASVALCMCFAFLLLGFLCCRSKKRDLGLDDAIFSHGQSSVRSHMFINSLNDWFHGPLTLHESEQRLVNDGLEDGKFLVWSPATASPTGPVYYLSLSCHSLLHHFPIVITDNALHIRGCTSRFTGLSSIIQHLHGQADGIPCVLRSAVSLSVSISATTSLPRVKVFNETDLLAANVVPQSSSASSENFPIVPSPVLPSDVVIEQLSVPSETERSNLSHGSSPQEENQPPSAPSVVKPQASLRFLNKPFERDDSQLITSQSSKRNKPAPPLPLESEPSMIPAQASDSQRQLSPPPLPERARMSKKEPTNGSSEVDMKQSDLEVFDPDYDNFDDPDELERTSPSTYSKFRDQPHLGEGKFDPEYDNFEDPDVPEPANPSTYAKFKDHHGDKDGDFDPEYDNFDDPDMPDGSPEYEDADVRLDLVPTSKASHIEEPPSIVPRASNLSYDNDIAIASSSSLLPVPVPARPPKPAQLVATQIPLHDANLQQAPPRPPPLQPSPQALIDSLPSIGPTRLVSEAQGALKLPQSFKEPASTVDYDEIDEASPPGLPATRASIAFMHQPLVAPNNPEVLKQISSLANHPPVQRPPKPLPMEALDNATVAQDLGSGVSIFSTSSVLMAPAVARQSLNIGVPSRQSVRRDDRGKLVLALDQGHAIEPTRPDDTRTTVANVLGTHESTSDSGAFYDAIDEAGEDWHDYESPVSETPSSSGTRSPIPTKVTYGSSTMTLTTAPKLLVVSELPAYESISRSNTIVNDNPPQPSYVNISSLTADSNRPDSRPPSTVPRTHLTGSIDTRMASVLPQTVVSALPPPILRPTPPTRLQNDPSMVPQSATTIHVVAQPTSSVLMPTPHTLVPIKEENPYEFDDSANIRQSFLGAAAFTSQATPAHFQPSVATSTHAIARLAPKPQHEEMLPQAPSQPVWVLSQGNAHIADTGSSDPLATGRENTESWYINQPSAAALPSTARTTPPATSVVQSVIQLVPPLTSSEAVRVPDYVNLRDLAPPPLPRQPKPIQEEEPENPDLDYFPMHNLDLQVAGLGAIHNQQALPLNDNISGLRNAGRSTTQGISSGISGNHTNREHIVGDLKEETTDDYEMMLPPHPSAASYLQHSHNEVSPIQLHPREPQLPPRVHREELAQPAPPRPPKQHQALEQQYQEQHGPHLNAHPSPISPVQSKQFVVPTDSGPSRPQAPLALQPQSEATTNLSSIAPSPVQPLTVSQIHPDVSHQQPPLLPPQKWLMSTSFQPLPQPSLPQPSSEQLPVQMPRLELPQQKSIPRQGIALPPPPVSQQPPLPPRLSQLSSPPLQQQEQLLPALSLHKPHAHAAVLPLPTRTPHELYTPQIPSEVQLLPPQPLLDPEQPLPPQASLQKQEPEKYQNPHRIVLPPSNRDDQAPTNTYLNLVELKRRFGIEDTPINTLQCRRKDLPIALPVDSYNNTTCFSSSLAVNSSACFQSEADDALEAKPPAYGPLLVSAIHPNMPRDEAEKLLIQCRSCQVDVNTVYLIRQRGTDTRYLVVSILFDDRFIHHLVEVVEPNVYRLNNNPNLFRGSPTDALASLGLQDGVQVYPV